ncbi:hypothetical protein SAMN02983003_0270 [Devosia enhydra]|uniref:UPF0178 protein SAMN02983003_0270 n=1 Tax=Devosia enhydra TaxID=665118 RepID=A0A1K2HSP3_9HYPH|nr:YaiI/YqxD family protein [Devosia enhydra]SFZ81024.1 hypothetical protein SAMN02983003_0270 [Devosia enhydra]
MSRKPMIYVDADACPVKAEVERVAYRHGLVVTHVAGRGMRPSRDPMIRVVGVPQGPDAADDWIVEALEPDDMVITADIGLAARAIENGAAALSPIGKPFTAESIGMALAMRDLNKHLRETGESDGHNPAFSAKDRSRFLVACDEMVSRVLARAK